MRIRDTITGREADVPPEFFRPGDPGQEYQWTQGNYSCDCNRAIILAAALGEGEEEADRQECGDSRFVLVDAPSLWACEPRP